MEQLMISKSSSGISRRQFLVSGSLTAAAAWLAPRNLFALEDNLVRNARREAATAKLTVEPLRGNVSVITGAGGNIAVLTGRDGKLMVDAGFITAQTSIKAALASINNDPLTHLINTHWHFDHADGNAWVHAAGATILAHENTRKHLSVDTRVEGWHFTFPAAPAGALPTNVFQNEHTVRINDATLALKHYAPAHTDSDISVHFTDADIFHAGDTFWNGAYPFIDYSTGGSIDGQIQAAEANLGNVTNKTIVIPGHGSVGGKTELAQFRDLLVSIRDKVAALKKQGSTLAEVIATKPCTRYDEDWGKSFMTPGAFIELVYQGV
jgi:glyoxylase-like metal-dependent hydrolase (beta-lactamase superfamily II)